MKTSSLNRYYVYVYIDPRNFEEFYYGKGQGNRKDAHLRDDGDTKKTKIIRDIKKAGLEPIIKVIARNLTQNEALLVEKTLIWKLGRNLTNISSGHFQDKFRPHDTFHLNLNEFDYANGIYYVNVGDGEVRSWEDCRSLGFMSAGQSPKYSKPLKTLNVGDIIVAYLKHKGYVGIGKITDTAKRILEFKINNAPLTKQDLKNPNLFKNSTNGDSEYLVKIDWKKTVPAEKARWKPRTKLFTTQLIKASLEKQVTTLAFLEKEFEVSFKDLMNN